jgi:glutamate-1-semialdehyde 2,1-aminomutase
LLMNEGEVYRWVERLGALMQHGLEEMIGRMGIKAVVCRQGSAFCLYFMDHSPTDWHDLAAHHDFELDQNMRRQLIEKGVYFFPLATKQCSISFAHTQADIERTLQQVENSLKQLLEAASLRDEKTVELR